LPDLDVLGFYAGVPYESFFGHRGFFHSLFFSFVLATFLAFLIRIISQKSQEISFAKLILCLGIIISSHGILDAMTTGGHGIALFSPFYEERLFLPWRVIKVSPMHVSAFLGEWGVKVLASEMFYVWLPLSFIVLVKKIMFAEK
jgi:inner membrane protein